MQNLSAMGFNYKNIELKWLGHSSFMILFNNQIIYIDPYKIQWEEYEVEKADIIFITHSHYDHCSIEDMQKLSKDGTMIVCTADCQSKLAKISRKIIVKLVSPGDRLNFEKEKIDFWTIPAYNIGKPIHTREEDWVGYILSLGGTQIYHAGDSDFIPEMKKLSTVKIDIAMLPIGGTYTMNGGEAATAAKFIQPKIAIPMHYGSIAGTGEDAKQFLKFCSAEGIETKILEKEDAFAK
jgi:L-ascorbate metabolism protein UlaG (beta-lactamase superfamily)